MMGWYREGEGLIWLLREDELRTWLAERGVTMRPDIPAAGQWRGRLLYEPKTALAFCEAQPDEDIWWT